MKAQRVRSWIDLSQPDERVHRCISIVGPGQLCGAPATVIDWAGGCFVCAAHAPPADKKPAGAVASPAPLNSDTKASVTDQENGGKL